ncbi:hypothetical protein MHK_006197 [Candidatus Magnetomorum sp. HK-1]|nr:hypothetical protein MHK_006197 [Candidatus Magnetomorum sp. HK-1]
MSKFCLNSDLLFKYQNGKLSKFKKYLVEKHLAGCSECLSNLAITYKLQNDPELNALKNARISSEQARVNIHKIKQKYCESSHVKQYKYKSLLNKVQTLGQDFHDNFIQLFNIPVLQPVRDYDEQRNEPKNFSVKYTKQVKKQFQEVVVNLSFILKENSLVDMIIDPLDKKHKKRMTLKKNNTDFLSEIVDTTYTIKNLSFDTYTLSFQPDTENDMYIFKIDKDGIHEY